MSFVSQVAKYKFNDASFWLLCFSNLFTIFLALKSNWDIATLLWIFWYQSIIIGFFAIFRFFKKRRIDILGMVLDPAEIHDPKSKMIIFVVKIVIALVFILAYGQFHVFYFWFLDLYFPKEIIFTVILLPVMIFFFNHLFSFFYNQNKDPQDQSVYKIFSLISVRILPMHLIIILGAFLFGRTTLLFLVIKMLTDLFAHIKEHDQSMQYFLAIKKDQPLQNLQQLK
jgi:hypothetical protein